MSSLLAIITFVSLIASVAALSTAIIGLNRVSVPGPTGSSGGGGSAAFPTTDAIFRINSATAGCSLLTSMQATAGTTVTLVFLTGSADQYFLFPPLTTAGDTIAVLNEPQTMNRKQLTDSTIVNTVLDVGGASFILFASSTNTFTVATSSLTNNGGSITGRLGQNSGDTWQLRVDYNHSFLKIPRTAVVSPASQIVAQNWQMWIESFTLNQIIIGGVCTNTADTVTDVPLFNYFIM